MVTTLRFGWNAFDDDNRLPFEFDAHTLGFNSIFADAIPVQKFPSLSITGYNGTGFTGKQDRRYYWYGFNGTLTKLYGAHNFKLGADYRQMGVDALSFGASAGDFTFNGTFSQGPNALSPSAATGNADRGSPARLSVQRIDGPADADPRVHALLQHVHPG